jgi:hypothetical protein
MDAVEGSNAVMRYDWLITPLYNSLIIPLTMVWGPHT